jgi:release factor glutamine methyltransferase
MTSQRAILKDSVRRLKEAGVDTPVLDARLLVEFGLGLDWAAMFTGPDRELTADEAEKVEALLQRRLSREPVSRIIGRRAFWKLELGIGPATLDPRPDTEALIMAVLRALPDQNAALSILDLGTGSGAILLALLGEYPHAKGLGVDISADAVDVASANALALGMPHRAEFLAQDWNQGLTGRYDMVVSNPPYIRSGDIPNLASEVKDYDPLAALDGGPDGLDAYRALAGIVPGLLAPAGMLALEVGKDQADEVQALFAAAGFGSFHRWTDLSGVERVITATKA